MNRKFSVVLMYALTPCHAGSGSALGVVDLPIQRERHTDYPVIFSSGVKGAFRANFERLKSKLGDSVKEFDGLTENIFGAKSDSSSGDDAGYAGAISVSDAKILAFPMRSSAAPFVWITCPTVLERLNRDLELAGKSEKITFSAPAGDEDAIALSGDLEGDILIEDYQVKAKKGEIKSELFAQTERLLLVSDEAFKYGVSCTPISAQIKIDSATGSTATGSLRYQEELPADTLMYCTIAWGDSKDSEATQKADAIEKFIKTAIDKYIQVGGDETLGRGIFKLEWK